MTVLNGGQRDENHPNRQVSRKRGQQAMLPGGRIPGADDKGDTLDPRDFPNLSPDQVKLANDNYAAFIAQYGPLKHPGKRGTF
ncbi:MAG: hypothetical protein EBR40_10505 [Proteobacteria bacterium]|nr:hypothetical protein [Pseudomonadota bacterium]